jgi:hypothetical protein
VSGDLGRPQNFKETTMSTRAIAPIVAASQRQVADDISGEQKCSPAREVTGRDGKTYTPKPDVKAA